MMRTYRSLVRIALIFISSLVIAACGDGSAPDILGLSSIFDSDSEEVNFPENSVEVIYTSDASTSDSRGLGVAYSLSGGADISQFGLSSTSGELWFINAQDFESPSDADKDNIYEVEISAYEIAVSDDPTEDKIWSVTLAVNLTNINEAPVFTSSSQIGAAENSAGVIYTAAASDIDAGDSQSFSLVGGADQSWLSLTGANLSFTTPPDYESASDADADNTYEVVIRVTDAGGLSADLSLSVNVAGVNEAPKITSTASELLVSENNNSVIYQVTATDEENDTLSYQLSGSDSAAFSISGTAIGFAPGPDYESPTDANTDNVYSITIEVSDGSNITTQALTVAVADLNDNAPVISSPQNFVVKENSANGTVVASVEATDADATATTYQDWKIIGGNSSSAFAIDPSSGDLSVAYRSALDYESGPTSYALMLTVSDGVNTSASAIVEVYVDDVNEAPVIAADQTFTIDEDETAGTALDKLAAADVDAGATLQDWTIVSGNTNAAFDLNAATGLLSLADSSELDYESTTSYFLAITVSDGSLTSATETITINIDDVNDNAPIITVGQSLSTEENSANGTLLGTITYSDDDSAEVNSFSWSIAEGNIDNVFAIDNSGGITVATSSKLDYETLTSYTLKLQVSDGYQSGEANLTINLIDVNDNKPEITTTSLEVNENSLEGSHIGTVEVTDADTESVNSFTWSIVDGNDNGAFNIDSASGDLAVNNSSKINHEADANQSLIIVVNDGANNSQGQTVVVDIKDVNEVPFFTSAPTATTSENNGSSIYTAIASDWDSGDSENLSYSITGTGGVGVDGSLFTFANNDSELSFIETPDYEKPSDHDTDNIYEVQLRVTDEGDLYSYLDLNISVTDINDNAPIITADQTFTIDENSENGISFGTVGFDDLDITDAVNTFAWQIDGGNTNSAFSIDSDDGELRVATSSELDHESTPSYTIKLTVNDGQQDSAEADITIKVNDVNEAPVINSASVNEVSVAENINYETYIVYRATATGSGDTPLATDPEGDTLSYSLSGEDASLFIIGSSDGIVKFQAAPDYDEPTDADKNNEYKIIIEVSDSIHIAEHAMDINLTGIDEPPVINNTTTIVNVAENIGTVLIEYDINATDPEGVSLTYDLSGVDAGNFNISSDGYISFKTSPNYEAPHDNSKGNDYQVTIGVSDSVLSTSQELTIAVTNVNEAPTADAGGGKVVNEGDEVILSASYEDPDEEGSNNTYKETIAYSWQEVDSNGNSVSKVDLTDVNTSSARLTFIAPEFTANDGNQGIDTLTFQLTITDQDGAQGQSTVEVAVYNLPVIESVYLDDGAYGIGDTATVYIQAANLETGLVLSEDSFNGGVLTDLIDMSNGLYSTKYFIESDHDSVADGGTVTTDIVLEDAYEHASESTKFITLAGAYIDTKNPTVDSISIPNEVMKIGDVVLVTIIVSNADGETLTLVEDSNIGGFTLGNLVKVSGSETNYTATFTIGEGGSDVASDENISVYVQLADEAGNPSNLYTKDIEQDSDSIDANSPAIESISIPNVPMKIRDEVVATITVSNADGEILTFSDDSSPIINGFALEKLTKDSDTNYTATFIVSEGGTNVASAEDISVSVQLADPAGNPSNQYTEVIAQDNDSIDANSPVITLVAIANEPMGVGEVIATLTVEDADGEQLSFAIDSTIAGYTLHGLSKHSDTNYTATFAISESGTDVASDENISVSIQLADPAGNPSNLYNDTIKQDSDSIDANSPVIASISIPDMPMKVLDEVVATFEVSNADGEELIFLAGSGPTINDFTLVDLYKDSDTNYTATFTISEAGTDVASDENISVSVQLVDPSGNPSNLYTDDIDQNSDSIDANSPTIDSVVVANGTHIVDGVVEINITASDKFNDVTGLTLSSNSFNGGSLGTVTDNADGTYTTSYTVVEGHADVADGGNVVVDLAFTDAAGNVGATTTAVSLSGESIDANSPTIDSVVVADGTHIVDGVVGITITATDKFADITGLTLSSNSFNGGSLGDVTDNNDGTYTTSYTVVEGHADVADGADVVVDLAFTDAAGNVGATTTTVSLSGESIDANSPTIDSVVVANGTHIVDGVVEITITASDKFDDVTDLTLSSNSFNGGSLGDVTDNDDGTYTTSYTVVEGHADVADGEDVIVELAFTDAAGNVGATTTTVSLSGESIDANSPTIDSVVVANGTHIVDGVVEINITASDKFNDVTGLMLSSNSFNGGSLGTVTDNADGTYTTSYTVVEGHADVADGGDVVVELGFSDAAGNVGATTTTVILAGESIDANSPTIDSVVVANGTHIVDGVVEINITASDKFNDVTGLTLSSNSFNGGSLGDVTDNDDGTYTTSYTVVEGHTDVADGGDVVVELGFSDAAGNVGATTTTVSLAGKSIDANSPTIDSVVVADGAYIVGDVVEINVTASDKFNDVTGLTLSSNSFNGGSLGDVTDNDDGTYTTSYTVVEGHTDVADGGDVVVELGFSDAAGNVGATTTTVSLAGESIDANSPTIDSVVVADGAYIVGDVVEINITASDKFNDVTGLALSSNSFNGSSLGDVTDNNDGTYTTSYTVVEGHADVADGHDVIVELAFTDAAGNVGATTTTVSLAGESIDANSPTIDSVVVANGTHIVDGVVEINITAYDKFNDVTGLTLSSNSFNGGSLGDVTDNDDGTYTTSYTVVEGHTDVVDGGDVVVELGFSDAAGNVGATITIVTLSGESIDANSPTIDSVVVADGTHIVDGVVEINITASDKFNDVTGLTLSSNSFNGGSLGTVTDNADGTYTTSYTVVEGHADVADGHDVIVELAFTDAAGNVGATTTAVSLAGESIDANSPTIDSVVVADGTHIVDGVVEINITASDKFNDVTGLTLSSNSFNGGSLGDVTDNADGTYTTSYTVVEGHADVADGQDVVVDLAFRDAAGNVGTTTTTVTLSGESIDANSPTIDSVVVADGTHIVDGVVEINITASDKFNDVTGLTLSSNSFNGGSLGTVTDNADGTYTTSYTVVEGHTDVADGGHVVVELGFSDAAGNVGATTTTVSLAGESIDANSPTIDSVVVADGTHIVDGVVGITITATDKFNDVTGLTLSSNSFNGGSLGDVTDNDDGTYTTSYTIVEGHADVADGQDVIVELAFSDAAGNVGATTTTVTLSGESIDANSPTIDSVVVADGTHIVDGVVEINITAYDKFNDVTGLTLSSNSFNGGSLGDVTDNDDGTYTTSYTVVEGHTDVVDGGDVVVELGFSDAAGNVGATITTVTLSGESIDANSPTIDSVVVADGTHIVDGVVEINITASDKFNDVTGLTLSSNSFNGGSLGTVTDNADGTYTTSYTVVEGHADVADGHDVIVELAFTDAAGNVGATTTTVSLAGESIDANSPTIDSVVVADGTHIVDGVVEINITASDKFNDVTGLTLSSNSFNGGSLGTVTDNADGTYTTSYTVVEGHADVADGGDVVVELGFSDAAGNVGATTTTVILAGESIDANSPTIDSVVVADGAYIVGDVVEINITAADNFNDITGLTLSSNSFNGGSLGDVTDNDDGTYTTSYTIVEGHADVADGQDVIVELAFTDAAGNVGATTTAVSLDGESIDANSPTIASVVVADGAYIVGDVVEINITAADNFNDITGLTLSSNSFNGGSLGTVTDNADGTYTTSYTVVEGHADVADGGNVVVDLAFTDAAGNVGATTTTVSLAGENIDANSPTIDSVVVADGTHIVDGVVGITITATDKFNDVTGLTLSSNSFNGGSLGDVTDNDDGTYTTSYTIVEGHADVADGEDVIVELAFSDAAGNVGATTTTVTLSGESIDANSPTIDSVVVADGTHIVDGVVEINITAADNFNDITGLTLSSNSFNGGSLGDVTDNNDGTYTTSYTVVEGHADVADGHDVIVELAFTDAAGNVGATTTTVSLAGESIDANSPTIDSVVVADGAYIVGDVVEINITASDKFNDVTGLTLSSNSFNGGSLGAVTDNDDGTYTTSYTVVEGHADVADGGDVIVELGFTDAAGNVGSTTTGVTLSGESIDANSPTIASVEIADGAYIVDGVVGITITASDKFNDVTGLTLSSNSFNGGSLGAVTDNDDGTYTTSYTVVEGHADVADGGDVIVELGFTDAAGNVGAVTEVVSFSGESIDANSPTIASVEITDGAYIVDGVVGITITAADKFNDITGLTLSSNSFNGGSLGEVTDNNDGSYTTTYTVVEGHADVADGEDVIVELAFTDAAGNVGATTTAVSLAGESIDANSPTIASVVVADGAYIVGDVVEINITAADNFNDITGLELSSKSFNGGSLGDVTDNADGTYTTSYTVVEGHADVADGQDVVVDLAFRDAAGNVGTTTTTVTLSGENIDANSPTIDSVVVANGTHIVDGVVEINITASDKFNDVTGLTLSSNSFNGGSLGDVTDNDDGTYTTSYTVVEGHADVADGGHVVVELGFSDAAGNVGATTTTVSLSGESIDANSPTIDSVVVANGTHIVDGVVEINITASDKFNDVTGLTLSSNSFNGSSLGDVTDNNDGTYTTSYTVVEGHADVADGGDVIVELAFTDAAGNVGSTTTGVILSGESIDANSPTIDSVDITDGAYIVDGVVGITITATDKFADITGLTLSSNSFNGGSLGTVTDNDDGTYTTSYTVVEGHADVADGQDVIVELAFTDAAGNVGATTTAVNLSGESIDANSPTIASVVVADGAYIVGDVVEINITASDKFNDVSGLTLSSNSFNGGSLGDVTDNADGTYTTSYTVVEGHADVADGADVVVDLAFTDAAGNVGATTTTVSLAGESIDANSPAIEKLSVEAGMHKIGAIVEINITAKDNEAGLTLLNKTFNGETLGTVIDNGDGTYTTSYKVANGNTDVADEGTVEVDLSFNSDTAGNEGIATTSVILASGTSIDANNPIIDTAQTTTTIGEGSIATLDASTSSDGDNGSGIVSYAWVQVDSDGASASELVDTDPNYVSLTPADDGTATFTALGIVDDDAVTTLSLYFKLTLIDAAGNGSSTSSPLAVTVTNTHITPKITASAGTAPDFGELSLSWPTTSGLTYDLYRSSAADCDLSDYTNCAHYALYEGVDLSGGAQVDTGLDLFSSYYYWLEAQLNGEIVSLSSAPLEANTTGPVLNDTGITSGGDYPSSFDSLGGGATCDGGYIDSNDDDGDGDTTDFIAFADEDCELGRDATNNDDSDGNAGFSFTKLDIDGTPLAANASAWSCVLDNTTGLIWEVKTDDGSWRDKDEGFTWHDPDNATFIGSESNQDTEDFITYANSSLEVNGGHGLCGRTDWRLPKVQEIQGLADYSAVVADGSGGYTTPAIDTTYFPHASTDPGKWYWTSQLNVDTAINANTSTSNYYAWAYGSALGNTSSGTDSSTVGATGNANLVRLVSSSTAVESYFSDYSDDRYTDNLDGTISDAKTGLMWMKCTYGQDYDTESNTCGNGAIPGDWLSAFTNAAASNSANNGNGAFAFTDWRLPNVKELGSIVDFGSHSPAINQSIFLNTASAAYWSSTPSKADDTQAITIGFQAGNYGAAARNTTATTYLRLVRDDIKTPRIITLNISNDGDNIVNTSDDLKNIAISGTTADIEDGQQITLVIDTATFYIAISNDSFNTTIDLSTIADGNYSVTADVSDSAGKGANQFTSTLRKDIVPPSIDTVVVAADDIINIAEANSATITGTTTDVEDGQILSLAISDGTIRAEHTISVTSNTFSTLVNLSTLTDSTNLSLTANVADSAGNEATQFTNTLIKDTAAPTIVITSIAEDNIINASEQSYVVIIGTASEDGQSVALAITDGATTVNETTTAVDKGLYSATIDLSSLAESTSISLTATIFDTAGNDANATQEDITKDTIAPVIDSIFVASDNYVNSKELSSPVVVSGATSGVEDSQPITININGQEIVTYVSANTFATDADLYGLSDGTYDLSASVADAAGNPEEFNSSFIIETVLPTQVVKPGSISLSHDNGSSPSDFLTNQAAQTISAELNASLGTDEALYASVDSGSTWLIIYDDENLTDSTTGNSTTGNSTTSFSWATTLQTGTNSIYFRVTDAADNNATDTEQPYTLDTNAPGFTSGATASIAENTSGTIYTAAADDTETNNLALALSYALSGTDAAELSIDSASGAIGFASPPDFETPKDASTDNTYEVTLEATDPAGNTANQVLTITVTDINDVAPVIDSNQSLTIMETSEINGTVGTVAVIDPDTVNTFTWSITDTDNGGATTIDNPSAYFTINSSTGEIAVTQALTENAAGAAGYDVSLNIQVNDGATDSAIEKVTITVQAAILPDDFGVAGIGAYLVKLTWTDDSDTYYIYRSSDSACDLANYNSCADGSLSSSVTPPFTDIVPKSGIAYYYWLHAERPNSTLIQTSATPISATPEPRLNDTGINFGGKYSSGNNSDCSSNISAPQDCDHGLDAGTTSADDDDGHAGFSYIKLDSDGNALSASATEWSCVRDNVTGLIWEVKTDDDSLHDKDDTYNWYNTNSETNGGSEGYADDDGDICYGYDSANSATFCNTEAFVARVNSAGLCGAHDWRLPNAAELHSLIAHFNVNGNGAYIETAYFPNTVTNIDAYWSDSPAGTHEADEAWRAFFRGGGSLTTTSKGAQNYARLVRGDEYIANDWSDTRYIVHNDGTVTDTNTSLMWMQCRLGQTYANDNCSGSPNIYNWDKALESVNNYTFPTTNGYSDWRLPNLRELFSLTAIDDSDEFNSNIFPIISDKHFYWSSSPVTDNGSHAFLIQYPGMYFRQYNRKNTLNLNYYVRLVRDTD